ncbi:MAG: hypothetical protein GX254_03965 [Clostridiales bacterium]|jgi:hypothetical protein|nr:hypothetical protein [Clostridiales bacterium]
MLKQMRERCIIPRIARKESECGVYHFMLRGINRQTVFVDEEDDEKKSKHNK